uniref:Serine/threonine-protein phosphatase 7 long form homolog n=1 Tax=Nicotiana tabacum TaxID=4097 RepID=A0A1S4BJQ6_TOBAC|nr:PREDICTED: serine/threonine-protein phosphatase 7 long form homolog [Nicotiana tabacum]
MTSLTPNAVPPGAKLEISIRYSHGGSPCASRTASRELLLLQGNHRSLHIWDGQCLSQTFRPRHIDDIWEFIRDYPLHPCIVRRLQDTGFYRIIEIGRLQFDWALITATIERWRPEMHTFYLPIGEATIMLEDVDVLFELPVNAAHRLPASGADYIEWGQSIVADARSAAFGGDGRGDYG